MNTQKILSWLLLLFGEAMIVTAFILFRGNTPDNILVLNIVVSSLIYSLFFFNYGTSWINLKDKSQKQVGALGISWLTTWIYAILATATMLMANVVLEIVFTTQLIVHGGLLFFLLMWLLLSRHSAEKVQNVYYQETFNRNGVVAMKFAMHSLKDKINSLSDLPERFVQRIDVLEENLRFVSPSNNSEACNLERSFVEVVNEIRSAIFDFSMNEEQIENNLKKLERIYQSRKDIYSN